MASPAGQGASGRTTGKPDKGPAYCAFCGRPDAQIRHGSEAFCSDQHAGEFAREVAALRAAEKAHR